MAGPYGSYGTDYRELQGPAQVDTDLPDNGAAQRAAALGSLFREFEGVSSDLGTKAQTQAGALAGAATGATGHPSYREGLQRFTAYGQAYNNAATGAYAIEAEAQADDTAARLRVQANNSPDTFRTTFSAARDAVLKVAPAQAVPMLTELYNKHLANGLAAVSGAQAQEQQQSQRQIYDEGIGRQMTRVGYLQGSDNKQDQLSAMDEHVKLNLMVDGGVNNGFYSVAEGEAMKVNAMRQITAQVFQSQFDKTLANDGGIAATDLLERFQQQHIQNASNPNEPVVLSEAEYQKLYADGITKLREYNLTIGESKRQGKSAEDLKFEAGDQQYTTLLMQGQLTERALAVAVRNGDLKPETARALRGQMLNGDTQKTNGTDLYRMMTDPHFLDMDAQGFASYPGTITGQDRLKAQESAQKRRDSWEGTQAVKDAKGQISAALKILPGTNVQSLSDEQRRGLTDATQEFLTLQQGTDPAKRDGMAATNAQIAVKHQQQREAAADVQMFQRARDNFIKTHGPTSPSPGNKDDYERRLKDYESKIQNAQATAKGD